MISKRKMDENEVDRLYQYALINGNLQGATEIKDHGKYFGNKVKIVKGKKDVGIVGEVFWLSRVHYGKSEFIGYSTRIGIRTDDNKTFFTNVDNVEVIDQ